MRLSLGIPLAGLCLFLAWPSPVSAQTTPPGMPTGNSLTQAPVTDPAPVLDAAIDRAGRFPARLRAALRAWRMGPSTRPNRVPDLAPPTRTRDRRAGVR